MSELRHSVIATMLVLLTLLACKQRDKDSGGSGSGGGPLAIPEPPKEKVVLDEFKTLKDGESWNYRVTKGTYRVEATATGDGVTVEWTGAACMNAPKEIRVFNTTCTLASDGQLSITNPTTFGLGASSSLTLKVTKLP